MGAGPKKLWLLSVKVKCRPLKPIPEKVAQMWVRQWAKQGRLAEVHAAGRVPSGVVPEVGGEDFLLPEP